MTLNNISNGGKILGPLIFLFAYLFPLNSFSEPSSLVEQLMNTPASMFDVGMIKIQQKLDSSRDTNSYTITYNYEKNRIRVFKFITSEKKVCDDEITCKNFIKSEISNVRDNLCVDDVVGKFDCGLYVVTELFSHGGYTTKNFYNGKSDEVAVKELKNNFYIEIYMYVKLNNLSKKIVCERLLTAGETFCTDAVEIGKR